MLFMVPRFQVTHFCVLLDGHWSLAWCQTQSCIIAHLIVICGFLDMWILAKLEQVFTKKKVDSITQPPHQLSIKVSLKALKRALLMGDPHQNDKNY